LGVSGAYKRVILNASVMTNFNIVKLNKNSKNKKSGQFEPFLPVNTLL